MQIAAAAAEVAIKENHNQNQVIISHTRQFDLPAEEQIAVVVAAGAITLRKFI